MAVARRQLSSGNAASFTSCNIAVYSVFHAGV